MEALLKFLFPSRLENPDSTGRLEVFGKFGPTDEEGWLRGGTHGTHVHTDGEVRTMAKHNCREALYDLFLPKDRSTVESIVDTLMPTAMSAYYSEDKVRRMFKDVRKNAEGRLDFTAMQEIIKESQKRRLNVLVKRAMGGKPIAPPKERPQKVPFQSKPADVLMEVTRKKKYTNLQEEMIATTKRMHKYGGLVATLEDQTLQSQVKMNSIMCRELGPLHDKWDRYCAHRRTGRSSYVQSRNTYRFNPSMDCGLGNKHPGLSSLLVASASGSSAAALLGAS